MRTSLRPAGFAFLLGLFSACASPEPQPQTVEPTPDRIERLRADVAWLADDAREGRRAGTAGEREAAEWLARQMEGLGLQPAGDPGSFLQAFEVPLPARDGGGSQVIHRSDDGETVHGAPGVQPLFCAEAGGVDGEVIFCGYGIDDPSLGHDDFGDVRGDGRIALVLRGVPPYDPPAAAEADAGTEAGEPTWGNNGSLFLKVMNAKRRGFEAVLVACHPDAVGDEAGAPPFDPSRGARAGLPALILSAEVAESLVPGGWGALVRPRDAARLTRAPTALDGLRVRLRADVERGSARATNVLGLVPGRDRSRTVVIGAHFDHLGHGGPGSLAGEAGQGEIHNGADDNASGTAVVLELARVWSPASKADPATSVGYGDQPRYNLLFALWSGEELGLLGSEHWASHPTVELEGVLANLNLDMVGRAGDGHLEILGAGSAAAFAGWLEGAAVEAGLDLSVSLSGQGLGGSDHQVFLRRGIPALHLFSGVHTDYHKPSDDVEGFEAEGTARVTQLTEGLLERLFSVEELAYVAPVVDPEAQPAAPRERGWSVWFGTVPEYGAEVKGLLLGGTSAGSPAEKAGLLAGDVILQVGDVTIETIHDFVYMLGVYKPGDVVLTRFLRDGVEQEVRITLDTRDAE